jgi:hypothetical protein
MAMKLSPPRSALVLLAAATLLGACADDSPSDSLQPYTEGAPSAPDASFPTVDAGPSSGSAFPVDAGLPTNRDAGATPRDATVPDGGGVDAGDASQVGAPADGGATDRDAASDAGITSDASISSDAGVTSDASISSDAETPRDASMDSGEPVGLAGTGLTAMVTSGQAISAADKKWTYVEFPDTSCRDGSRAGVTLYRNSASKKLMFFFEGGGACFDDLTCAANPAAVDATDRSGPTGGILDMNRTQNPFKDWNVVYVPYCTGDVFGGTKPSGNVPGVGPQKFVGYLNTAAFLQRIAPTFRDATDLLVTGVSAGGFGAASNVIQIQRAFPNVRGKLIDDSGPPMSGKVIAPCLQKKWRDTWGLDQSMLKECGASCTKPDEFTFDFGLHLAKTFQGRFSGLIEAAEDGIISGFFGAGSDFLGGGPCSGAALLTPVDAKVFHEGLLAFREALKPYTTFGTYIPPGTQHTWLMGDSFYTANVDGVSLLQWVKNIIDEKSATHVGK